MFNLSLADINQTVSKCTICPCAKQVRVSFPSSSSSSLHNFDLLYMDIWRPYKMATFDGYKYFLNVVDDFSRMTWVLLLRIKLDICIVLKTFLTYIRTQFSKNVKVVRSDNGIEFVNANCNELFKSLGIVHQNSCASKPQKMG